MPVPLYYEFVCIRAEEILNMKIFDLFFVWVNEILSEHTFRVGYRFWIKVPVGCPVRLILLHGDDFLQKIDLAHPGII